MRAILWCILIIPTLVHGFCFDDAGKEYRVDPILLESIARVESNMDPTAYHRNRNGTWDIGLMQINSSWLKGLGLTTGDLISDPCLNTMVGARILRQCMDVYGYSWEAVGCYNARGKEKRVDYAWKVFHRLNGKEQRNNVTAPPSPARQGSLFFAVRDITAPPEHRAQP